MLQDLRDIDSRCPYTEMKASIESNSDFDRQRFNNSALTNFLLQNGCQVKHLKACYLKYLLNHSSKV